MNLKNFCYSTILASTLLTHPVFAKTNIITFKNQRGSILELTVLPNTIVKGYFTTAVASPSCPQAINTKRPISGYLVGNALAINISYPMCESVVSISGNFNEAYDRIDTIAILSKQAANVINEGIGSRFLIHDFYKRIG